MRGWRLAALLLVLAAGCGRHGAPEAADPDDLQRRALAKEAYIAGVGLSPSGRWAVVRTGNGLELHPTAIQWTHRGGAGPTWLVDLVEGQARRLDMSTCIDPWSPDGRKLAIVVGGDAQSARFQETGLRGSSPEPPTGLGVYDVETGATRVLVPPDPKGVWSYGTPVWSPDGRWLAFTASYFDSSTRPPTTKPSQLRTVPVDGSAPSRVEAESVGAWWWSADGKHLLCYADPQPRTVMTRVDKRTTRHVLPPVTSKGRLARVVRVTGPWQIGGRSRWSPDRRVLALPGYTSRGQDGLMHDRLWLLDAKLRPIMEAPYSHGPEGSPAWSRDGRSALISISYSTDVRAGLYVIDLARRTTSLVRNPALEGVTPVGWVQRGGKEQLLCIDSHEHKLLIVEDLKAPVYTLAHVQDDGSLAFDLAPDRGEQG